MGEKFVFLNITCKGFKAGALNEALKYTNEKAEILAVIDADYMVGETWLVDLVPLFDDPKAFLFKHHKITVDNESLIKQAMNAEYAGFFDIGMVERNEENAIVAHGTMMARLSAMHEVGDWTTYTIVEDSELGLRLFEAGYSAHYAVNRRYGWGLLPDTVEAFRNPTPPMGIWSHSNFKTPHWQHFMPSSTTLTSYQKYHFVAGWFFWLSDAFGALTVFLNILGTFYYFRRGHYPNTSFNAAYCGCIFGQYLTCPHFIPYTSKVKKNLKKIIS